MLSVAAIVLAFHVVATSAPRLARQAIAPAEASLSLFLRGLCSLTRVASLVLLVSQHFCL